MAIFSQVTRSHLLIQVFIGKAILAHFKTGIRHHIIVGLGQKAFGDPVKKGQRDDEYEEVEYALRNLMGYRDRKGQ